MNNSNSIDQRIVEMKFENAQFEKGIATSMKSLDGLKKSLDNKDYAANFNNTLAKINDASKNISFDAMAAGITAIQNRFSTLGIIGMRVIENLTDTMMGFAKKAVSFVSDAIVGGGKRRAMNIENARFQLQGLLKDEEKVNAVMQNAQDSVNETAYGMDEAAKAAAQFAASGLQAGDEMLHALSGITGVAAMTNSDYESISRIFTNVAGNGRLMGDQLLSLSSRGLNAAATLAEYFNGISDGSIEASESVTNSVKALTGGLKVGEADIREFISKGKLSFEIFADAMYQSFGEHAKKANDTVTGALSNVRAAFSRIGAAFISPLIEQKGPLVQLLNAIRIQVNKIKEGILPLADTVTKALNKMMLSATSFVESLDLTYPIESFYNILYSIKNLFSFIATLTSPIKDAFLDVFPLLSTEKIAKITASIKDFTAGLSVSSDTLDKLRRIFKGLFSIIAIARDILASLIDGFADLVKELWPANTGMLEFLASIGDSIVAFKNYAKENDVFREAINKVTNAIVVARDKITEFVNKVKEKAKEYPFFEAFLALVDRIKLRLSNLDVIFSNVKKAISGLFEKISDSLQRNGVTEFLPKIGKLFKDVFGNIIHVIGNFARTLSENLRDGDFTGFFDTINAFILGFTGLKINSVFGSIDHMLFKFSGFGSAFKKALANTKIALIEYQAKIQADAIFEIAKAIGLLALSLLVLSGIDSQALTLASAAVATLFGDLIASMAMLGQVSGGSLGSALGTTHMWSTLSSALIKMAAAVLILSIAMKSLSSLEWGEIAKGLTAVLGLAIIVVGMAASMTMMGGKMAKGAIGVVILSYAIKNLAEVCKDLSSMSWEEIGKGLAAVGGLMLEMAVFSRLAKSGIGKATGLVIMVASIKLLVGVFKELSGMDMDVIKTGLIAMGGLLAELAIFARVASGSKGLIKTGVAMVLLGASLEILVDVLNKLNQMNGDELKRGLWAVAASLTAFVLALNLAKGTMGASAAILVATAALGLMVPIIKALGTMPILDIVQGIGAIAAILGVLVIAGYAAQPVILTILALAAACTLLGVGFIGIGAGLLLASTGITGLAVGLSALGASLDIVAAGVVAFLGLIVVGILGLIPTIVQIAKQLLLAVTDVIVEGAPAIANALIALLEALSDVTGEIAGFITTILVEVILVVFEELLAAVDEHIEPLTDSFLSICIKFINVLAKRIPELVPALGNLIGSIGAEVKKLIENIDPASILSFFGGIAAMSLIFKLLAGSAKDAMKAAITIGLMLVLVGGITAAFLLLKDVEAIDTLAKATAISEVMLALAGVMKILQGVNVAGALTAIADMDLMLLNLTAVLTALGALYQIPGLQDIIDDGAEFLGTIGSAVGGFVGNIIGSFAEGISNSLPTIGQNLSDFATNISGFFTTISDISDDKLALAGTLAEVLLKFTAAELINGIASLLGGGLDLEEFGSQLESFGPHLKQFGEDVTGLKTDAVEAAANAADMIIAFAKDVPSQGGLLDKIIGSNDLKTFGENIVAFGPNLKQFGDDVEGLKTDAVETAARAADMIIAFAKDVPAQGGLLDKIIGSNDLETFGENIVKFGPNLKQFSIDVEGLKSDAVETASTAAGMIIAFAKEVPNSGGILSWIVGDNKIDTFGEDLQTFGKGLKGYSDQAVLLNKTKIDESVTIVNDLIDLGNKAPSADTTWNLTSLGGRLGGLGGDGTSFGEQLLSFSTYVSECDWTEINKATSAIKLLMDKVEEHSPTGPEALKSFGEGLVSISNFTVDGFVNAILNATEALEKAGQNMMDHFLTGMGKGTRSQDSEAYAIVTGIVEEIDGYLSSVKVLGGMKTAGTDLVTKFNDGLKEGKNLFKLTFASAITSLKVSLRDSYTQFVAIGQTFARKFGEGFRSNYNAFYTAGEYAVSGLVQGVKDNKDKVYDTAYNIAKAAELGMKAGLREKSPSKATYEVGDYAALGLINALHDSLGKVYAAGQDVSNSALDGVRGAIANVSAMLTDEVDTEPVIRPILDDSELQNGVRGIASLFNSNSSFALRGATAIAGNLSAKNLTLDANGNPIGNTYNFNQYNSSPKALNRLEIYRQTKNLFASTKARVGAI